MRKIESLNFAHKKQRPTQRGWIVVMFCVFVFRRLGLGDLGAEESFACEGVGTTEAEAAIDVVGAAGGG
jgi:hypothetical protein